MDRTTFIWTHSVFPDSIVLEGRKGESREYVQERTCNLIEDGDVLHCSDCGAAAAEQSWAYWNYCPNCGSKVVE